MKVVFAPGARADIAEAHAWWTVNRPDAPMLVATELADAFRALPGIASALPCFRRIGALELRRQHIARVHRHVYFHLVGDEIVVLAVWGAVRGLLPRLRQRVG